MEIVLVIVTQQAQEGIWLDFRVESPPNSCLHSYRDSAKNRQNPAGPQYSRLRWSVPCSHEELFLCCPCDECSAHWSFAFYRAKEITRSFTDIPFPRTLLGWVNLRTGCRLQLSLCCGSEVLALTNMVTRATRQQFSLLTPIYLGWLKWQEFRLYLLFCKLCH